MSNQRKQKLEFIMGMLKELETMAKGERFDMVTYLIGTALLEAHDLATGENNGQAPPVSGQSLTIRTSQ